MEILPCIRGDCVTAPSNVPSLTAALITDPASNPAATILSSSVPSLFRFWLAVRTPSADTWFDPNIAIVSSLFMMLEASVAHSSTVVCAGTATSRTTSADA